MSSSRALCCLLIRIYFYTFRNKLSVPFTVVAICFRSIHDKKIFYILTRGHGLKLKAELITPTSTLIILDITKSESNNCLIYTGDKLIILPVCGRHLLDL